MSAVSGTLKQRTHCVRTWRRANGLEATEPHLGYSPVDGGISLACEALAEIHPKNGFNLTKTEDSW